MRIGLDIDDVIYPWYDTAHEICLEAGIVQATADGQFVTPTTWATYEEYGCSREAWVRALEDAGSRLYDSAPLPSFVMSFHELVQAGHDIWFVTARGSFGSQAMQANIKRWTLDWFNLWVPRYSDRVIFSRDKTILNSNAFLDDRVDNAEAVALTGSMAVVQNRPWNKNIETKLPRVDTFDQFVSLVNRIEGGA